MGKSAIVESGSCQYLVQENDIIQVEKLDHEKGIEIALDRVLMFKNDDQVQIGTPFVSGAKVRCEVLNDQLQPKVINYHYRRRKNSRRKKGHRQILTCLKIKAIEG